MILKLWCFRESWRQDCHLLNTCGQQGVTDSIWHCLCQVTLSVVGLSAQQIWDFLNTRWSNPMFASLPIIILCLCVYAVLMSCIHWLCLLFTQIRHFLEPRNEGESWLRAQLPYVCLSLQIGSWLHCCSRQKCIVSWKALTGNRLHKFEMLD